MRPTKPITIVGGGLAGLALGIALRQKEVPVTVWEAGAYPRHRVCGEFIHGRGLQLLDSLGLLPLLRQAGARPASSLQLFTPQRSGPLQTLPEPALCLPRFALDALLARVFCRQGGRLKTPERWRGSAQEGVVRASGRQIRPFTGGWRWFGLKVHAQNLRLQADLELHFTAQGYVGLCQVEEHTVNICGLFRSRATVPDLARNWRHWMQGEPGSVLAQRLQGAVFLPETFCSVAGLAFGPGRSAPSGHCWVGDAWGMIAPLTGNGMSMAFESAGLALEPLVNYSYNSSSWDQARGTLHDSARAAFSRRLRWAGFLQSVLFHPPCRELLLGLTRHVPGAWPWLLRSTR